MKILQDRLSYKNICALVLNEIDVDDVKSFGKMIDIIKLLSKGSEYYFDLSSADDLLCSDREFEYYEVHLPGLIQNYGKYSLKFKKNNKRFQAIANLPINIITHKEFEYIWRYYLGEVFFNPYSAFTWNDFENIYNTIKPELYGIGYIQRGFTDMTFTKGHDGDNLIIAFNTDKFDIEKIKYDIRQIINTMD